MAGLGAGIAAVPAVAAVGAGAAFFVPTVAAAGAMTGDLAGQGISHALGWQHGVNPGETLLAGGTALAGGIVGEAFARAPQSINTQDLLNRAQEIHSVLDPIAQRMRTTAVLSTDGPTIIGGGVVNLTRAQRSLLIDGELAAREASAHAEPTVLHLALKLGWNPKAIAVTRDFCPECHQFIINSGGTITGPRTAIWY